VIARNFQCGARLPPPPADLPRRCPALTHHWVTLRRTVPTIRVEGVGKIHTSGCSTHGTRRKQQNILVLPFSLLYPPFPSLIHTQTQTHTHTHTHTHIHTCIHTHNTHTHVCTARRTRQYPSTHPMSDASHMLSCTEEPSKTFAPTQMCQIYVVMSMTLR
jgi:hypothetical protein